MVLQVLSRVFGSKNDRELKRMAKIVNSINALETEFEQLDDAQLKAKRDELRLRVENGETLDAVL